MRGIMKMRSRAVSPTTSDDEAGGTLREWAERSGHLLRASANFSAERYAWARAGLEDVATLAREGVRGMRRGFSPSMAQAAQASRQYIARHPWRALAAALGMGLLAGVLWGMQAAHHRGGVPGGRK